jgi:Xaa-Pro aminopeptidase
MRGSRDRLGKSARGLPLMHSEEFETLGDTEQFIWSDADGPDEAATACMKGIQRLLVEPTLPSWALFAVRGASGAEIELDTRVLQTLRLTKDDGEIEQLRHAASVTDGVIEWIG